ncbi:DUF6504 family protein [Aestuariimicrobium sp. p3-SID1156]|uniref:DUF6504 family protein n=1 Tax=Aestuariimicrobium sp. p3-SID1156 TaxID=2916038 RepID=UPI00223ACFF9|nr:DUF6504 family protein [Aestuariimicrobium sp. p3-SID1156]MCT1458891.1 DUF6504 family protein [Aestuariimicrobium sp. p3-SID1156]
MRRHDDQIEVTCDRDGAPSRFRWRGALWRVLAVENHWNETGSWWTGPAVRAARGEDVEGSDLEVELVGGDLLDELVVWRVEAANGLPGSRGIYELAHAPARAAWQLKGVLD